MEYKIMAIRIVVLRHGKPESEGYADDALRPLSSEGEKVQRELTKLLQEKGVEPTHILTSPLLRAEQTAQIASDVFGVEYEKEENLGNDFDGEALLQRISDCGPNATVFLVGHAPTLGKFVNRLTGDEPIKEGLSKSSAAIVDFDNQVLFGTGKFFDYFKA